MHWWVDIPSTPLTTTTRSGMGLFKGKGRTSSRQTVGREENQVYCLLAAAAPSAAFKSQFERKRLLYVNSGRGFPSSSVKDDGK